MILHVWSVLCQSASFDIQTNRVSLFNTLESVQAFEIPSNEKPVVLSCEIVSLWARAEGDAPCSGQMRAYLEGPNQDNPQMITLEIDLTRTPFHRTRISIGALPITTTGRFMFKIEYLPASEETWLPAVILPFIVTTLKPEKNLYT